MKMSEKIRYYRDRAGMLQSDLGKTLGVSAQAVSKWELGKAEPDRDSIAKMCAIFNISANDLMDIPYIIDKDEQRVRDSALVMLSGINAGEADLVNLYRQLNQLGQLELKHYAEYLINKSEYQAAPPVVSVS